jgi:hypothetical protein
VNPVNTAETVLVILLAVGFLALLTLSIILLTMMIAIMKNVRRISQRAEEASANAAEVVSMMGKKFAPIAASTVVAAIMRRFRGKKE